MICSSQFIISNSWVLILHGSYMMFTVAIICIDTAKDQTIKSSIIQHIQWHLHPVKDGEHQVHC